LKPTTIVRRLAGRCLILGLSLVLPWLSAGCREQPRPREHAVFRGTVESLRADTGQLTVSALGAGQRQQPNQKLSFLLTNDTEVYINDRFTSFDSIEIGDTVELIAYPDPDIREERFVVSLASITRNVPAPAEPDLSPPASAPTTQPKES